MKLYFHFLTGLLTQIPPDSDSNLKAAQNKVISSQRSAELNEEHKRATKLREDTQAIRDREIYLQNQVSGSLFTSTGSRTSTSTDGRTSSES